jgi:hypothetical protein
VGSEDLAEGGTATASLEHCALWRGRQLHDVSQREIPPVPPFQGFADELGPGYGRWLQTGEREFKLTFYAVLRKEGVVNGYQRIQSTMALSESGDQFTVHEGRVDFLDVNWKVVFSTTDEVTGTRLKTPDRP